VNAAQNKSTGYVGRKLGRNRHRWQDEEKLFSEICCLI